MLTNSRPPASAEADALLRIEGLTKRFTGTLALDHVDFVARAGEVHALLGENGAGKSTLIKVLAGVYPADAGSVYLDGKQVEPASQRLPIAFIHQELGLVGPMTVAENIALVAGYGRRGRLISWRKVRRQAIECLSAMGSSIDPGAQVETLTAAEKSLVAIARALAVKADLLVLDEPTASLPETDVAHLFEALRRLRSAGVGIIYVTHRLDEVFRIADRVTVLRDGRNVATMPVSETTPSDLVVKIVGRKLAEVTMPSPSESAGTMLELENVRTGSVGPVSFRVGRGEILGLVGLTGAGHHAVGRAIFGDTALSSGFIRLEGSVTRHSDPAMAIRHGVGFVSSKRTEESLAGSLSVQENIFPNPVHAGGSALRLLRHGRERERCNEALVQFDVRPRDPSRSVNTLSGGNQQKVVLARWLAAGSRLLVLEEPTAGVDVGSRADIYGILEEVLAAGNAVLLVSSDFEEVVRICHRALVFNRGRVAAALSREELSVSRIIELASADLRSGPQGAVA
jgi:ribose transport system ATP-binding protein